MLRCARSPAVAALTLRLWRLVLSLLVRLLRVESLGGRLVVALRRRLGIGILLLRRVALALELRRLRVPCRLWHREACSGTLRCAP